MYPYRSAVVCGEIVATEDDFEGPSLPHEPGKPLGAAPARDDAHTDFRLSEDGLADRTEPHVEAEHELAASPSRSALDLGDAHLRHPPEDLGRLDQVVEFRARRQGLPTEHHQHVHIEVGDEEVGVRAVEDRHLHRVVCQDLPCQPNEFRRKLEGKQVDRRVVDRDEGHATVHTDLQELIPFISHCRPPFL